MCLYVGNALQSSRLSSSLFNGPLQNANPFSLTSPHLLRFHFGGSNRTHKALEAPSFYTLADFQGARSLIVFFFVFRGV